MKSHERFKQLREETGLTMREFASQNNIALSTLVCYENGKRPLSHISIKKAVTIFNGLSEPIDEFYNQYYNYQDEILQRYKEWELLYPTDLSYQSLNSKIYFRLAKLRERKRLPVEKVQQLTEQYQSIFKKLEVLQDENGMLSNETYDEYVIPLLYSIRSLINVTDERDLVSKKIAEAMCKKNMTDVQLAFLVDVTKKFLTKCKEKQGEGYKSLKVVTVMKICLVLDIKLSDFIKWLNIEKKQ